MPNILLALKAFLKENPDVSTRIMKKVQDALGLSQKEPKEAEATLAHRGKSGEE